jgi:hypothetical protein
MGRRKSNAGRQRVWTTVLDATRLRMDAIRTITGETEGSLVDRLVAAEWVGLGLDKDTDEEAA